MNDQLVEAIRQLHLKPGESYTVEVDGRQMEIREQNAAEPSVYAGQVMMMPWFESPDPSGNKTVILQRGPLPLPDPVIIPDDAEFRE